MKRIHPQRFSREVSQFIAYQINQLNKQDCKKVYRDLKHVTPENQWNYVEYRLRDVLAALIHDRYLSLN